MCGTAVLKEGKIRAWKDVRYRSIEGGKDQSMEGCAGPQYGRKEKSEHGMMSRTTVWHEVKKQYGRTGRPEH
jgi:hypothetical protein